MRKVEGRLRQQIVGEMKDIKVEMGVDEVISIKNEDEKDKKFKID